MTFYRFIRPSERKWKLTNPRPSGPTWLTSAAGNKYFVWKDSHVVVFPTANERVQGSLVWRLMVNAVMDQRAYDTQVAAMEAGLKAAGVRREPVSTEQVQSPAESVEGRRRIKA